MVVEGASSQQQVTLFEKEDTVPSSATACTLIVWAEVVEVRLAKVYEVEVVDVSSTLFT